MARPVASLPAGSRITGYSRNRGNRRGVKRKKSNYNPRPRKRQRTRCVDVAQRIRIIK